MQGKIVHKTQSGQTLSQTLCKRELRAPGCPFKLITIWYEFSVDLIWTFNLATIYYRCELFQWNGYNVLFINADYLPLTSYQIYFLDGHWALAFANFRISIFYCKCFHLLSWYVLLYRCRALIIFLSRILSSHLAKL
jgi:hypothetical protein